MPTAKPTTSPGVQRSPCLWKQRQAPSGFGAETDRERLRETPPRVTKAEYRAKIHHCRAPTSHRGDARQPWHWKPGRRLRAPRQRRPPCLDWSTSTSESAAWSSLPKRRQADLHLRERRQVVLHLPSAGGWSSTSPGLHLQGPSPGETAAGVWRAASAKRVLDE